MFDKNQVIQTQLSTFPSNLAEDMQDIMRILNQAFLKRINIGEKGNYQDRGKNRKKSNYEDRNKHLHVNFNIADVLNLNIADVFKCSILYFSYCSLFYVFK